MPSSARGHVVSRLESAEFIAPSVAPRFLGEQLLLSPCCAREALLVGQRGRIESDAPDPGTRAMWNLRFRNTFRIGAHAEGILIRASPHKSGCWAVVCRKYFRRCSHQQERPHREVSLDARSTSDGLLVLRVLWRPDDSVQASLREVHPVLPVA
jgi:hypothetical protein